MALQHGRNALILLLSLLLAGFLAEAALTRKKTEVNEKLTFRGSMKKATKNEADKDDSDDEDDDDDDDDDAEQTHAVVHENKAVEKVKEQLAENMREQVELKRKIKHLTDAPRSDQEIDASAALVGNETQSPAMANMLGKMWKEMRMFETPFYAEHVEEKLQHLKLEQKTLEGKLAAVEQKSSPSPKKEAPAAAVKKEAGGDDAAVVATLTGHNDCQCIGIDNIEGETIATLKDGSKVDYPADLGGSCQAWDLNKHPQCPGASWCKQKWCYVDPCKCKNVGVLPKPSIYLKGAKYQGKPVHFSYATCGGKDSYSSEEEKARTAKDIAATCAVKVDSDKWGAENCRCIGISPQPGHTKVNINGKKVDFPADTGAVCKAWEQDNHPDCDKDDAPDWCNQAWCYVDPCSCTLPTPPKTSSYLPGATYQGVQLYYSYKTCGGRDNWSAGDDKACVNIREQDSCNRVEKCGWTGKECLGKELADVCYGGVRMEKAGSWSPKAIVALVLPCIALLY